MEITIPNSRTPKFATRDPFAEFRLILKRDGENITLEIPKPKCFRDFHRFTGAEKDAYNAIVTYLVETSSTALKKVVRA